MRRAMSPSFSRKKIGSLGLATLALAGFFLLLRPSAAEVTQRRKAPQASPADSFSLSQSSPTRVFTPNGDGVNDTFTLVCNNPAGNIIAEKKIYDLTGAEVADFQVIGDETAPLVTLVWDGRDHAGNIVRSGVYIYQIQSEGKVINGTIVVAR